LKESLYLQKLLRS